MIDPKTALGARIGPDGLTVTAWSGHATGLWLCTFDGETETRTPMRRSRGGSFTATVPGGPGTRYGLRADGPFAPDRGHRFDPAKLLVDPYATRLDRPFAYAPASPSAAPTPPA